MRFRRVRQAVAEPAPEAVAPPVDLSGIDWRALYAELRRRGWQLFPEGGFEATVAKLEARAEKAEALLETARGEWQEIRPTVDQLTHIAGEKFPDLVDESIELRRENTALHRRAVRAERDFSTVAQALIDEEFPEARDTLDHDND